MHVDIYLNTHRLVRSPASCVDLRNFELMSSNILQNIICSIFVLKEFQNEKESLSTLEMKSVFILLFSTAITGRRKFYLTLK